jgi:hypothetical protein
MIGGDAEVPCVDGRMRRYVDLDYAASTPAMAGVWADVRALPRTPRYEPRAASASARPLRS